jgi:hypothetical protein
MGDRQHFRTFAALELTRDGKFIVFDQTASVLTKALSHEDPTNCAADLVLRIGRIKNARFIAVERARD